MIWKTRMLVALLVFSLLVPAAWGCTCAESGPTPCGSLDPKGTPLFLGTVEFVENPPPEGPVGQSGLSRYRFRVDEKFAGEIGAEVDVYSGRGGGDCSFHFRTGEQYLVYPYQETDGRLFATICSPTRNVRYALAELPQLRAMRDHGVVASLYGTLRQTLQPYESVQDAEFEGPLSNTLVQLRSEGEGPRFESRTNQQGVFAFYNIPGGTYRFWASLPPHLELAQTILSDPLPPLTLPDGACYERNLEALPTGRIRGRVLDVDNNPARGSVELFRSERYDPNQPPWWSWSEYQGDRDHFEFDHVAPGKYILVFNKQNRLSPESPYPRTFYPNAIDRERAVTIEIAEGQQILDADIRVTAARATRAITVHVKWGNGKLPKDVYVRAVPSEGTRPYATRVENDAFRLKLLRGVQYAIHATQDCGLRWEGNTGSPIGERVTESVVVHGSDDAVTEITLVLTNPDCEPYRRPLRR